MKIRFALMGLLLGWTATSHAVVTTINLDDYLVTPIEFAPTGFSSDDIDSLDGSVTLHAAAGAGDGNPADISDNTGTATYRDFSSAFSGDDIFGFDTNEYVLNGDENFDVIFNNGPQHFFAGIFFDTADDSIFTLDFLLDGSSVGTFTLPPVSAITTADFNVPLTLGFTSTAAFNSITVREFDDFTGTTNSDEFFQFLHVQEAPAPATLALLAVGLLGIGAARRRA